MFLFLDFSYVMKMTRGFFDVMCARQVLFSTYHRFSSSLHIFFLNNNKPSSSFKIFCCDPPHDFPRIHIYIHTYTHIHTYIHIYIHTYAHIHTLFDIYTYIHTYIHTHTYIHYLIFIHIYIHTHIYIHIYIHTYIHTYIRTHTYIIWYSYRWNPSPPFARSETKGLCRIYLGFLTVSTGA